MQSDGKGLRELRREETYRRIHDAALELVKRDGLADASVSAIAARAEISRRTFFNYFGTKEDAVLGLPPPSVSPETLEIFAQTPIGDDRVREVLKMALTAMAPLSPISRRNEVRKLLEEYPELTDRVRRYRIAVADLLATALSDRLAQENPAAHAADSARAVILLAGAVLQFAARRDPASFDNPDSAAIESALTAFKTALREI